MAALAEERARAEPVLDVADVEEAQGLVEPLVHLLAVAGVDDEARERRVQHRRHAAHLAEARGALEQEHVRVVLRRRREVDGWHVLRRHVLAAEDLQTGLGAGGHRTMEKGSVQA